MVLCGHVWCVLCVTHSFLCGRVTKMMIVMMMTMIMSVCTCQSIIHMCTICVVHTRAHECAHCFICLLPDTYPSCRCATGIGDKEELEPRDLGEPMPPPFSCPHTKKEASLAATAVVVTCVVNQLGQQNHAQTQTPKEIDHYREHRLEQGPETSGLPLRRVCERALSEVKASHG